MAEEFKPGYYIFQNLASSTPFITVEMTLGNDVYKPLVAVPPGVGFTVFKIEPLFHTEALQAHAGLTNGSFGQFNITWFGNPVIPAPNGKVIVRKGSFTGYGWNIERKVTPSGAAGWTISLPPGPEVYRWSVSKDSPSGNFDSHGHKYVSLNDNPVPELTEIFYVTPFTDTTLDRSFAVKGLFTEDLPATNGHAGKEIGEGATFARQPSVSSD